MASKYDTPPNYSASPPPYPYDNSKDMPINNANYNNMERGIVSGSPTVNQGGSAPPAQNAGNANWGDFGSGLTDKVVRLRFIRKVYLLVTLQLSFTFTICLIFTAVEPIRDWITKTTGGLILYIIA